MTLIIRAISSKRTIYISDGRKTVNNEIISDSINKIVIIKKNSLFALSGVIDDEKGKNNFDLIKALEKKDFEYCTNLILARQNIVDTIIDEYNKDIKGTKHKCHLMYSIISHGKVFNENIVVEKEKCFGLFHLKNSLLPLDIISWSLRKTGLNLFPDYIDFITDNPDLIKNFNIDFNHYYGDGPNSMPIYFKHVIPHLFLQSIYKISGNKISIDIFNSLSQSDIDKIGYDFFTEFNKINIDKRIGNYQMGSSFELQLINIFKSSTNYIFIILRHLYKKLSQKN